MLIATFITPTLIKVGLIKGIISHVSDAAPEPFSLLILLQNTVHPVNNCNKLKQEANMP